MDTIYSLFILKYQRRICGQKRIFCLLDIPGPSPGKKKKTTNNQAKTVNGSALKLLINVLLA